MTRRGKQLGLGVLLAAAAAIALVTLVSCGDGGGSDTPTGTTSGKTVLVAALGDSITAGAPRWDPNPRNRRKLPQSALDRRNQYEYWGERASEGRLRFRNCGIWGQVTAQIARRLDRCARGAQQLIIQGGGNDIAHKRGVAEAGRNLERMVRRGKKLGLKVMLADVSPFGGLLTWKRQVRRLNRFIRVIGERQHVRVLPFYEILVDPGNPGVYDPALTEDYIHPSIEGHKRLAQLFRAPGNTEGLEE